ncbi:MAG: RNA polymerase subunit sigma-24 [Bacteroidetes bacterium GWA2_31_9]|nr:MAG: RNA polymerase subunit sigma-24 [Bacteroidetes bacterium GWA2_31_9]
MTAQDYNKIVDLYSDNVYRFILKNIRDKDKAMDIVQDSFEKLWINVNKIESQKAKSYLFTTAYHTMIDYIRKEKKMVLMDEQADYYLPDNKQYSDLKEILEKAVSLLPEDQRSVVLLRDYEGYSYEEISEITGLSESQVKVYIFRARTFLKKYIGSMEVLV